MRHTTLFLVTALFAAPAVAADVVKPGDCLVVDGIPPIPVALAERVAAYIFPAGFRAER
jgi:hypothetical protein